jgi:hypothetical protein
MRKLLVLVVICVSALGMFSCGGSSEGCPGLVCNDCGGSGNCDVDCQPPDVEFCGAFGYFDDPGLRCAFCAPEDTEL